VAGEPARLGAGPGLMPRGDFDRSARKAQTRARLLEAAARVYARAGFGGATLQLFKMLPYVVSLLALAGAAGILTSIQQPSIDPLMGVNAGLKAFVAAVLGGIGNLPGAALGGILIGLTEALVVGYVNPTYRDPIVFGVLILVLLVKPTGLLGASEREKV